MNWTLDQKKVIDLRDCNILVSAAAGSGKTAVLIERIISRVLDQQNPVQVDEFLIVTFTRAAAAQMRERLQKALEKALVEDPENSYLHRQLMLLPSAQISTIHSFCGYVIQNYFHRTGVDPAYRIGSDSELGMIRKDVLDVLLEEKYTEKDDDFLELAKMSRFLKSDAELEELILKLYYMAISEPFPADFFERMRKFLSIESEEDLWESDLWKQNEEYFRSMLRGIIEEYQEMIRICALPDAPVVYIDTLQDELFGFQQLLEPCENLGHKVNLVTFSRMPSVKKGSADEELKKKVQGCRDKVKKTWANLVSDCFGETTEHLLSNMKNMRPYIETILSMTEEFMRRFAEEKQSRNIMEFSDLEQMALEILLEKNEDGERVPSAAARELSEQFEEIMIDEYQDSNLVQDMLLRSIARDNNMFMVGDIKQSIYRFRMACPDLFLDKLNTYEEKENSLHRRIHLSNNFRSRDIVLNAVNVIFDSIMHADLGGVEYDENARLHLGANYPESDANIADNVEVYAIEDGTFEHEAKLIANLIKEQMEAPLYVLDGEQYRPLKYGDIVILVRSTKTAGKILYDTFSAAGIPVNMENTSGFFSTREISILVNMLLVIDNPRQDIPLVSILRSPFGGFTDDELAIIKANNRTTKEFYKCFVSYDAEDEIGEKIIRFKELLEACRQEMSYLTVADVIENIYERTNIHYILCAMSHGEQRKANLDRLLEIAREFDQTSYKGLHQFVRYLGGIKSREEDLGEANLLGEKDDVVRIMTIHKSKGLEFPVCIVAGMGRRLDGKPESGLLSIHSDYGIAGPVIDNERGTAKDHMFQHAIKRINKMESRGEELRVLYVAMTRAKEKLIMTGCYKQEKIPGNLNFYQRIGASSYFDWILPVVSRNPEFMVHWVGAEQLELSELSRQVDVLVDTTMLKSFDTSFVYDEEIKELLEYMDAYVEVIPEEIPNKLSVSEIKKKSMEEHAEENFQILDSEVEIEKPIPHFAAGDAKEDGALVGANYGTVWHQVMAALQLNQVETKESIEKELERMEQVGMIQQGGRELIRVAKLQRFFATTLGREMIEASEKKCLYREQPFVFRKPAYEVVDETSSNEPVLVQGIIDGYYEKEDGIVLLDYKTDHLEKGQEDVLVNRYRAQMDLYAEALEHVTGREVIRKVLYSFSLDKEIDV